MNLQNMRGLKLALVLMAAGGAAKGASIIVYRVGQFPVLAKVLLACDPLAKRFADTILPFFFRRGIAPAGEAVVYEILLVFAFAAECFVLGLIIGEARRIIDADRRR